jgi:hypothetical protein
MRPSILRRRSVRDNVAAHPRAHNKEVQEHRGQDHRRRTTERHPNNHTN